MRNGKRAQFACLTLIVLVLGVLSGCKGESRVYATVAGAAEVAVVDPKKGEVTDEIPVGEGPAVIIAKPDQSKVYTANWGDNTVSAIDTRTHEVTEIPMTARPYVITMAPDGDHVYAGLYANEIAVIDTETDTVERTIATTMLPASLFVSPDEDKLYVATTGTEPGRIWSISPETGEIIDEPIDVGLAPGWITMKPNGETIYTLNLYTDDISVVDTESWTVEDTIPTGEGSRGVLGTVTPDNETLYVTNLGTHELMAIDTASNEIVQQISFDGRASGVGHSLFAKRVYVSDYGPQSLERPLDTVFLSTGEWQFDNPGTVNVVNPKNGKVTQRVEVGPGPTDVVGVTVFKRVLPDHVDAKGSYRSQ